MRYITFVCDFPEDAPRHWPTDEEKWYFDWESPQYGKLSIRKHANGMLDCLVAPLWGPPLAVEGIQIQDELVSAAPIAKVRLVWETPCYCLWMDNMLLFRIHDRRLKVAAELGVPFSFFSSLSTIERRALSKLPEEGTAWELDEIPTAVTIRNSFSKETAGDFLNKPRNTTQKDRELTAIWCYAKLTFGTADESKRIISVLQPAEDRGIDGYIRVIDKNPFTIHDVPIQVAEIRLRDDTTDLEEFSARQLESAKRARILSNSTTLLCSFRSESVRDLLVDFGKLRDAFKAREDWPFRRVVILAVSQGGSVCVTLYSKDGHYFFIRQLDNGPPEAYVGFTLDEMNRNREENKTGIVSIPI